MLGNGCSHGLPSPVSGRDDERLTSSSPQGGSMHPRAPPGELAEGRAPLRSKPSIWHIPSAD